MPTVKHPRTKIHKAVAPTEEHDEAVESEVLPVKIKKAIEIDEPEPAVIGVEEKLEEDPLATPTEDDEAEELSLDGEELNPFGDRWEE
ncbi:MAG: hypothetical protein AAB365_03270 [Patescibacteria group bacterium]